MFLRDQSHVHVPQTQRANDREVRNNAGGYVYAVDDWTRLDRFLTLGTEGGTFYVDQKTLTDDNTRVLKGLLDVDGPRVVARVLEISKAGRAVKQDYGLFALALACASPNLETRSAAYGAIAGVCRTASTLFQLVSYLKGRRGWSRGLRTAIAGWYNQRDVDRLAYQLLKYPSRHGFAHRDLLRLAHVDPLEHQRLLHPSEDAASSATRSALYRWAVGKDVEDPATLPEIVNGFRLAHSDAMDHDRVAFARTLPREALPTEWLNDPAAWEGLIYGPGEGKGMPLTAMIRNLGNLSKCGLLTPGSEAAEYVAGELQNRERLAAARIHPISVLIAEKVYGAGRGVRGSGAWTAVESVVSALQAAFELAMPNVEASGKDLLVAIDVSGSMTSQHVAGIPDLTPAEVSIAMSYVHLRTEPKCQLLTFDTNYEFVNLDPAISFDRYRARMFMRGGGTDLSLPFVAAGAAIAPFDAIITYTDNETWAGHGHPDQAFDEYTHTRGGRVKAVVASATATPYRMLPQRPNVLHVCGFDAAVPAVIADFVRDEMVTAA